MRRNQRTPQGLLWAVDSVAPINAATLANVRGWYTGSPMPILWGRYIGGDFGLRRGELAFAKAHHIGVYLIVPDRDCSICDGGADICGRDSTAAQAEQDARAAVRTAQRLRVPAGTRLFKDIEQVGACYGELTSDYLLAWYRYVRHSEYRVGLYGNTYKQHYDFPRAYCAAARHHHRFVHDVTLAQDEPEPQIGAPRGTIGPRNAPKFAPYYPHCVRPSTVKIWQYGESGTSEDLTDADEIKPGIYGLITPDGKVT